jgi:membrane protein
MDMIDRREMSQSAVNQIKCLNVKFQNIKNHLLKISIVQLIFRTIEGAVNRDIAQRATGVAYYAMLSIFPLLLGLIAILGFSCLQ